MKNSLSFARIVKLLVNDLSGMETAKKFRYNFGDVILVFYGVTYNACFRTFLWKKTTLFHGSIQDLSNSLVWSKTTFFKSQTNNMKSVALRLLCVHRDVSCQNRHSFYLSLHLWMASTKNMTNWHTQRDGCN